MSDWGERDAAEVVLEQLDEQWFCDNVVRWPPSCPGSPPGVVDKEPADAKPRPWGANAPRARHEIRRLSDGDHHLRRHLERDAAPRWRALEAEDHPRLVSSQPQTPTKRGDPSRFCSEASALDGLSPLALPIAGPLVGVTEDEEMENDLFARMLANRPAKLSSINPGRLARGPPLQENRSTPPERKPQVRQRRRLKGTKSLTDLEYEELRGLKDLGFEVSKDDLTPHVVRMFPGLQRQGIPPYNSSPLSHADHPSLARPRVPAVHHLLWPRRPDSPSPTPPSLDPSVDMKGQLKSWASEMASIVSIEC